MLKSEYKQNIVTVIYARGLLPDNTQLLCRLHPMFFVNETKLKNALKKLNEESYIKKVRTYPHKERAKKDAYILAPKGTKEAKRIIEERDLNILQSDKLKQRLKNKQYNVLYRLVETDLIFIGIDCYINRDTAIYNLYPGELTHANKSLRFNGVIKTSDQYIPIYNLRSGNREINVENEKLFFKKLNESKNLNSIIFNKILLADDYKVIDSLVFRKNENENIYNSKKKKYAYHSLRYDNEHTFLINKEYAKDIIFFYKFRKIYQEEFENGIHKMFPDMIDFGSGFNVNNSKEYCVAMLFFDIKKVENLYKRISETVKKYPDITINIYTHSANMDIFTYTFLKYEQVNVYFADTQDIFEICKKGRKNAA